MISITKLRTRITLLQKVLIIEQKKNTKLREQLQLEQDCCEIERILNKEEVQKYKQIAEDISKEYMLYVQEHPDDSSDSDSEEYIDVEDITDSSDSE